MKTFWTDALGCVALTASIGAAVIWAVPAKAETPLFGFIPMTSLSSPAGATAKQTGDIKHADFCGDFKAVDAWGQCLPINPQYGSIGPSSNTFGQEGRVNTSRTSSPAPAPAPSDDGCGPKGDKSARGEGRGHGHHNHSPS